MLLPGICLVPQYSKQVDWKAKDTQKHDRPVVQVQTASELTSGGNMAETYRVLAASRS